MLDGFAVTVGTFAGVGVGVGSAVGTGVSVGAGGDSTVSVAVGFVVRATSGIVVPTAAGDGMTGFAGTAPIHATNHIANGAVAIASTLFLVTRNVILP